MCSCCGCETEPVITAHTPPVVATLAARLGRWRRILGGTAHGQLSGPWFGRHPRTAAAVIAISSVGVLALQFLDTRGSDAIALLYVLPIGLAAVTSGVAGGLAAAAGGYLAFALFAVYSGADHVGPDGWLTRAAAMFLLGGLLGRARDQTGRATRLALAHQRQRLIAEEMNRRYSEGIELSDSILQHLAAAKWSIEQGDDARAVRLLTQALTSGREMVSELLPSRSTSPSGFPGPGGPVGSPSVDPSVESTAARPVPGAGRAGPRRSERPDPPPRRRDRRGEGGPTTRAGVLPSPHG